MQRCCLYRLLSEKRAPLQLLPSLFASLHSGSTDRRDTSSFSQTKQRFSSRMKRLSKLSAKRFVDSSPSHIRRYLRLLRVDRPIGTWLLLWPCTWSIGLAGQSGHLPDVKLLALFGVGAFLMRGSGCVINDLWDRDIDRKVTRTQQRPLASGEVSEFQATALLGVTLSASLLVLLQLNWYSVFLGAASLGLVATYPYMKRITFWPQLHLGLTMNYGVLLGWSAVRGSVDWSLALPLYAAAVAWTLVYDTIYAHQDKYDDLLAGVRSTALLFGDNTKVWLTAFSSVTFAGLVTTGYMTGQLWPYWLAVATMTGHLTRQVWTVNLDDPEDCGRKFRSNAAIGAVLFGGIVVSKLLKRDRTTGDTDRRVERTL